MVTILLARGGAKKRQFYHIVVTDNRNARDGYFIERIGFFNPIATGKAVSLGFDLDRIKHWISNGAIISKRVSMLINNAK